MEYFLLRHSGVARKRQQRSTTGLSAFGVKGNALARLSEHPRIFSTDSCAFEFRARVVSREAGISKSIDLRLGVLDQWMSKQVPAGAEQLQLCV